MRLGVDLNNLEIFGPPIAAMALSLYLGNGTNSVLHGLAALGSYAVTKAIAVGGQKLHALEVFGPPILVTGLSAINGQGTNAVVHGLAALGSYAITKTVATAEAPRKRATL